MVNIYLKFLQEDDKHLNEFIVLPVVILAAKLYKKYTEHKKIAIHCLGKTNIEKKKCFLIYKINAIEKTIIEVNKFKTTCKKWSTDIPKCITKVNKEVTKLTNEIKKLKTKLTRL